MSIKKKTTEYGEKEISCCETMMIMMMKMMREVKIIEIRQHKGETGQVRYKPEQCNMVIFSPIVFMYIDITLISFISELKVASKKHSS